APKDDVVLEGAGGQPLLRFYEQRVLEDGVVLDLELAPLDIEAGVEGRHISGHPAAALHGDARRARVARRIAIPEEAVADDLDKELFGRRQGIERRVVAMFLAADEQPSRI